jgi:hypothetical protein
VNLFFLVLPLFPVQPHRLPDERNGSLGLVELCYYRLPRPVRRIRGKSFYGAPIRPGYVDREITRIIASYLLRTFEGLVLVQVRAPGPDELVARLLYYPGTAVGGQQ